MASKKDNNGKVSTKQLYDEIMPIVRDIAQHTTEITNMKENIKSIKDNIDDCNKSFVSRPAFFGWLGALSVVISIAIILLKIL
jgi:peptidoglycan hydrolase CwlO-like protein